jgi:hypothetical protein
MEKRKVISRKNLPTRLPIWPTAIIWLLMDYYNASDITHGVVWTIWAILWIVVIVNFWTEEEKEVV